MFKMFQEREMGNLLSISPMLFRGEVRTQNAKKTKAMVLLKSLIKPKIAKTIKLL